MLFCRRIRERRNALRCRFDIAKQFEAIEESCIPSYAHANLLAAWVSWQRLQQAAALYTALAPNGDVLDFGAATGELAHLLGLDRNYWFIEENEILVDALQAWLPNARRAKTDSIESNQFSTVFALDSLEHNSDIEPIVGRLQDGLTKNGLLILSGPTENAIYKIGRRIAGFGGHYHFQTIWDIEACVAKSMQLVDRRIVPFRVPLFSVSAWRRR
jgi:2-polyprenyl-3-methyl-5-hydroxy-6-metoxy-1,4-benzoquinol methylase